MNSFTKGLLTGVFGVVVGLLISGSNYQSEEVGRYQISTDTDNDRINRIYETIIDTRSGKDVSRQMVKIYGPTGLYEEVGN